MKIALSSQVRTTSLKIFLWAQPGYLMIIIGNFTKSFSNHKEAHTYPLPFTADRHNIFSIMNIRNLPTSLQSERGANFTDLVCFSFGRTSLNQAHARHGAVNHSLRTELSLATGQVRLLLADCSQIPHLLSLLSPGCICHLCFCLQSL